MLCTTAINTSAEVRRPQGAQHVVDGGKPGVDPREAYWKERSVIRREDDVDERAILNKVEECCEEAEL